MNKPFPILLSIPHGGAETPDELKGRVRLSQKDLFDDGDSFTREIYGIKDDVTALVETNVARAFVDLNRDVSDLPPRNPDGVVKSHTCYGKPVYHPGKELEKESTEILLKKYYHPCHEKIREVLKTQKDIKLALDCHSMASIGPKISPDQGKKRPMICLGTNQGKSCPMEIAGRLAECFKNAFELEKNEVTIDRPFSGGFITKTYGNHQVPWLQVEMNRELYLKEPWFDEKTLEIRSERLEELRNKFKKTLYLFSDVKTP